MDTAEALATLREAAEPGTTADSTPATEDESTPVEVESVPNDDEPAAGDATADREPIADRERRREAARTLFYATRVPFRKHDLDADALPTLAAAATDADPLVRGHATAVLGDLGVQLTDYDEPVPELRSVLERLRDEDQTVRQTALGSLSQRSERLPRLFGDCDAEAVGEREAEAASELRALAARGLVDRLRDDLDLVRHRAASLLTPSLALEHPDVDDTVVSALLGALDDEHAVVRSELWSFLPELARRRPDAFVARVDEIEPFLQSDDQWARLGAAETLGHLGVGEDETLRDDVASALSELVAEGSRYTAPDAVDTLHDLVETVPELATPAGDVLVEALSDPQYPVRSAAAVALADLAERHPERAPPVASSLRDVPTDDALDGDGVYPLAELARVAPQTAGELLADLCRRAVDPDVGFGLGQGGVCREVADVDPAAVAPAVVALAEILEEPAAAAASEVVRGEAVPPAAALNEAAHTAGWLAELHPETVVEAAAPLAASLDALDDRPREMAAGGLAAVARSNPDAIEPSVDGLLDLLGDPIASVRHDVAVVLATVILETDAEGPPVAVTLAEHLSSNYAEQLESLALLLFQTTDPEADGEAPRLADAAPEWPLGPIVAEHPEFVARDAALEQVRALRRDAENVDPEAVAAFVSELAAGSPQHVAAAVDELVSMLSTEGAQFEQALTVLASVAGAAPAVLPDDLPAGLDAEALRARCDAAPEASDDDRVITGRSLAVAGTIDSEAVEPALAALAVHLDGEERDPWKALHVLSAAAETVPGVVEPVAEAAYRVFGAEEPPGWAWNCSFDPLEDALQDVDDAVLEDAEGERAPQSTEDGAPSDREEGIGAAEAEEDGAEEDEAAKDEGAAERDSTSDDQSSLRDWLPFGD